MGRIREGLRSRDTRRAAALAVAGALSLAFAFAAASLPARSVDPSEHSAAAVPITETQMRANARTSVDRACTDLARDSSELSRALACAFAKEQLKPCASIDAVHAAITPHLTGLGSKARVRVEGQGPCMTGYAVFDASEALVLYRGGPARLPLRRR